MWPRAAQNCAAAATAVKIQLTTELKEAHDSQMAEVELSRSLGIALPANNDIIWVARRALAANPGGERPT